LEEVVSDLFEEPPGATPLDESEREALIPTWIATRADLNLVEQENIATASMWVFSRHRGIGDISQTFLRDLHRRMFKDVWRWAGKYRTRETNIGVPPTSIAIEVENLLQDLQEQADHLADLPWTADEVAVRFHHRLVATHPFPNGNGRHARLAADIAAKALGRDVFSWGAGAQLAEVGPMRAQYLEGVRIADRIGDYEPLLAFARA
jgi:Fic-DOC domain mobile mystery protein B